MIAMHDDDDDDDRPLVDAFDGEHLLVADKPCDECLFSKNKLIDDGPKEELLRQCYERGTYFICHKATLMRRAVICHSFVKSTDGGGNAAIRVAQFFGLIKYVDPAAPPDQGSREESEGGSVSRTTTARRAR